MGKNTTSLIFEKFKAESVRKQSSPAYPKHLFTIKCTLSIPKYQELAKNELFLTTLLKKIENNF